MTETLTIAAVQADPTVGAVSANEALAAERLAAATAQGADLAVFSELFLIGYPPEDLALKPAAVSACREALDRLAAQTRNACAALIGAGAPAFGGSVTSGSAQGLAKGPTAAREIAASRHAASARRSTHRG